MRGESRLDLLANYKITFNEMRPGINGGPMSFTQIVENGHFMALIQQELRANASNITRPANDKDLHWRRKCSVINAKSKTSSRNDLQQCGALNRDALLI